MIHTILAAGPDNDFWDGLGMCAMFVGAGVMWKLMFR